MYAGPLHLTFAGLVIFLQFVPSVFQPLQQLVNVYGQYQTLEPNIKATYELLDTRPAVPEREGAWDMRGVHGHITFEKVSFGYSPSETLLDEISFRVSEGETVALVGPIGCGKSTLLNLLLRFLAPRSGRIIIDGHDIADVTHKSLRTEVSKLSQFPFFFKTSIRENIELGAPGAGDELIEEASRLAHVHDIIMDPHHIPAGYETVVDTHMPSGGQKRLIALARCLIRKPEILLLDEPTENLDVDQRNRLVRVLREYALERTCIVISHDLNFVAAVSDRILVLNQGRIADEGTHDELIGRGGLYKTLYELENIDPARLRWRPVPVGPNGPN
jgi:ABC-type multidrug transport system fused ATPase/permease subunit